MKKSKMDSKELLEHLEEFKNEVVVKISEETNAFKNRMAHLEYKLEIIQAAIEEIHRKEKETRNPWTKVKASKTKDWYESIVKK